MGILSAFLSLFGSAIELTNVALDLEESSRNETARREYQKTIFLWYFSKKPSKVMDKDKYPNYLSYNCEINDISVFHRKMIDEGYFCSSSNEEKLSMLTIPEIKEILKKSKLPTKGKKSVLIQCVLENISEKELKKFLPYEMYSLSQKGFEYIEKNKDCVRLHQCRYLYIDWEEYCSAKEEGFSFYDTVWRVLNKKIIEDKFNFGRSEYSQMAQLLDEEGRHKEALSTFLRVLYIDLRGKGDDVIIFAPGIVNKIAEHREFFSDEMIDELYQWKLSKRCNKKLFTKFVHDIMNNSFDEKQAEIELRNSRNTTISREKDKNDNVS